jgi:hypothetical protein
MNCFFGLAGCRLQATLAGWRAAIFDLTHSSVAFDIHPYYCSQDNGFVVKATLNYKYSSLNSL